MIWILHDLDEWTTKVSHKNFGKDPFGNPIGCVSYQLVRRPPEEVAEIKARKQKKREDAILTEAADIKARRRVKRR